MPGPIIYTVTPNPALDLSGSVARLVPNEKNYVYAERRDPGGNGINSARIITRLKQTSVTALGFTGGSTGREIEELLKAEGVNTRFLRIRGHTRINVTANNDEDHRQTRLTFPGPKISPPERAALLRQISKLRAPGLLIVSGSLPAGLPADFHARLADAGRARGLGVIADVPAKFMKAFAPRSKGRHSPLLLVKPNQAELEEWAGRALRTDGEIIEAARGLLHTPDHPGISALVCVSLAERGAILLSASRAWMGYAPQIRARGTVGAGDSLVGAMAGRLAAGGILSPSRITEGPESVAVLEDALAWGLAAGAATAESAGTSLARPAEIRRLRKQVRTESLWV